MPDSQESARSAATGESAGELTPLLNPVDEVVTTIVTIDEKPLPGRQVALLCLARVVEPVAFFAVFPYINQMVQDNGGVADADVGFYSGLIESLFSLTQAIVMLAWGRAADRVGRKPVLVLSLVGMAAATALFGLARSLPQMIAFRCLAGLFAGTIVTIRTMLAEHSTPATQARIFSWFAFSGNLGIFLGPLLGGVLADPLRQHGPGTTTITKTPFLAAYPYALPGFVVAALGFVAATMCALFVDETLVRGPGNDGNEADPTVSPTTSTISTSTTPSLRYLVSAPGVAIVLYVYAHVMLLAFAYTALVPVFWFTPVRLGGLGFSPLQISAMMCINGASQAAWLLLVFPPLQRRLGTNGVMRLCAAAYPVFLAVSPLVATLLRYAPDRLLGPATTAFWIVTPPLLAVGSGVSMCFTAVQLALNDVAPSPRLLGTLNALALTGSSAMRAFAPAAFTSLFAVGVRSQLLDGYAIWLLMVALGLGYVVAARYLPDYDALKKQREEEE
ncbi:major facilitator superfamily transporter [Grosmannia clavigera kw1407]|uniref:Major facilitator superfamily transporter n=1 Tax=Grosmannia clavigera (strain kw1407 / UAMH 11150) TaxID=655863 RepID=F0XMY5_GROCL|nr:major facilitator superfamily transporter [Grosmannia clavigera kw1407]EFX00883.1 major facilitator superfamily transporter [Grosmannia clavigera kw1407]